ncbi:kinase-like domain-containing protein [Rhizophagus clarus]|uniref:Kinase-like domain-containing protein n=1 Tax=Rhizophagus clarus TaxID=94130 RepID=A0A8H3MC59_9GLOM|nr:kinase-like domain-containing protein [Rhizophagus clarus]
MRFQRNFENWTSGNNNIDKFIRDTQLSAHDNYYMDYALEWIPYDRLRDIKYIAEVELGNVYRANWIDGNITLEWIPYDRLIAKEESGKMYSANWIDGNISFWDHINQNWKRINHNMIVILKNLNYLKNILMEFTDEINKPCGITQHSETKNYMIVFNNRCKKCNYACNTMYFKRNFKNWTSGNKDIDKFIQDTQLLSHTEDELPKVLEWIPYDRFCDMKYIAKGGFGKVYKATWIDGIIFKWSNITSNWERNHKNMSVALKSLDNSKNITSEFINEVMLHNKVAIDNLFVISFYGITQDPDTTNYMMVLDYAENGSLRNYLNKKYDELNWNSKIDYIYDVTLGLKSIHEKEVIHRDLHIGNILRLNIKLFGIIMYEIISGLPPYYNLSHDNNLAIRICQGLRPRFNIKVPHLIVHLIKRCLDADPLNRPEAKEIDEIISTWQYLSTVIIYYSVRVMHSN